MAGSSVTFTEKTHTSVKEVYAVWVSDDSAGTASGTTTYGYDGELIMVQFDPDGGATTPADSYDITIKDANGVDVINSLGANLTNAATVTKARSDGLLAVSGSKLTFAVSGAGNSKGGTIRLSLR